MGSLCSNEQSVVQGKDGRSRQVAKYSRFMDINTQFEFICFLGNGSFGKVRLYRDKNCKEALYAIKTLKKEGLSKLVYDCLIEEVNILSSLDHPNIVKYYGTFENSQYLHIEMEYLKGDNLYKIISLKNYNELDEKEMALIIRQLLKALLFIHNKNIVHRDIKPENVVFGKKDDYSTLKLIDFGLATTTRNKKKLSCGTPYYMAPEIVEGRFYPKTDIWSVGVIIYFMITGKFPFNATKNEDIFEIIMKKPFNPIELERTDCSDEAKDLVKRILVKDPEKRLSTEECLAHPWIKRFAEANCRNYVTINTIKTLKNFETKNLLQKELLFFIAKITREDEIKQLKNLFNQLDRGNTGTITIKDIKQAYHEIGLEVTQEDLDKIWKGLDFHNDGEVNYTEFLAAMISSYLFDKEEKLWSIFCFFTNSNDEKKCIDVDTLIIKARSLKLSINEKLLRDNFEELQKQGKKLDFKEFKALLAPDIE